MKKLSSKIGIFVPLVLCTQLAGVSIVYNLRVSQITRMRGADIKYTSPSTAGLGLLDQTRTWTDSTIKDNIVGNFASYTYTRDNFYCRADMAWGNVQSKNKERRFSRTQTDDFLLTFGYSKSVTERTKITLSLLLGFPTHKDTILEGIQFGTGHNGFGLQCEGVFRFAQEDKHSILAAARYIRFCPASIDLAAQERCLSFDLDLGNLVDLLIGYNYRFKTNMLEVGYNPSFLFSATISPEILNISSLNYIRSSFFGAYKHFFLKTQHPQAVIAALSYGFDNKPKVIKRIITVWAAWGIMF